VGYSAATMTAGGTNARATLEYIRFH
jgi:hypothetical protein